MFRNAPWKDSWPASVGTPHESAYGTDVDAAYVSLKEIAAGEARHQVVVQADALASGSEIILDLDADGRLIGIEVLGARNGLPPELLKVAKQL